MAFSHNRSMFSYLAVIVFIGTMLTFSSIHAAPAGDSVAVEASPWQEWQSKRAQLGDFLKTANRDAEDATAEPNQATSEPSDGPTGGNEGSGPQVQEIPEMTKEEAIERAKELKRKVPKNKWNQAGLIILLIIVVWVTFLCNVFYQLCYAIPAAIEAKYASIKIVPDRSHHGKAHSEGASSTDKSAGSSDASSNKA